MLKNVSVEINKLLVLTMLNVLKFVIVLLFPQLLILRDFATLYNTFDSTQVK